MTTSYIYPLQYMLQYMHCTQYIQQIVGGSQMLIPNSQSFQYPAIELLSLEEFQEISWQVICFSSRTNIKFLTRFQVSFGETLNILYLCLLIMVILMFLPANSNICIICGLLLFFKILIVGLDDDILPQRQLCFSLFDTELSPFNPTDCVWSAISCRSIKLSFRLFHPHPLDMASWVFD